MSAFGPLAPSSRAQRDAEADDARARRLAGEFGQLLEGRREALGRTASARAESDPGGVRSAGGAGAPGEASRAAFERSAGTAGRAADRRPGGSPEPPAGHARPRGADARTPSPASPTDGARETDGAGTEARSAGRASARRAPHAAPDGGAGAPAAPVRSDAPTSGAPARAVDAAASERGRTGSARSRAESGEAVDRALDLRADGSATALDSIARDGCAKAAHDAIEARSRAPDPTAAVPMDAAARAARAAPGEPAVSASAVMSTATSAAALLAPETVTAVARLLSERLANEARPDGAADGVATWRFSLLDEHDGTSLAFAVTRHAAGHLAVTLDEGDEARHAPLLDELVARLAALDERIVLEAPSHG